MRVQPIALLGIAPPFRLGQVHQRAAIDALAILLHPRSHFRQDLLALHRNLALGIRPDAEKHVPVLADTFDGPIVLADFDAQHVRRHASPATERFTQRLILRELS